LADASLPTSCLHPLVVSVVLAVGVHSALAVAPYEAAAATEKQSAPLRIEVVSPGPGEIVKNTVHLAPVRGSAQSGSGEPTDFDVFVAIDVSHSTRYPSGIDVDEDGEVGFNPELELVDPGRYPDGMVCTDAADSILAAEVQAARLLLDALDARHTRIGILTFSGESDPKTGRRKSYDQRDAVVVLPLSNDFEAVRVALEQIVERGPHGATNFSAAIQLAVSELAGLPSAQSEPRQGAKKVLLFLTDGKPTFPIGQASREDPGDIEAAINAARLAQKAGVMINAFAIGPNALASPVAITEMSRLTGGTYTPVRDPGQIVAFLQGVSFANVEDVVIRNLTTKEVSFDVSLNPDGSFSGFVPVQLGTNTVEVTALASDGGEESVRFEFDFEKSGLSELELARELERIKARNKELMRLIERKRIQSFRDRQRKELEIEVEEPEGD
jgi:hypothetical protein